MIFNAESPCSWLSQCGKYQIVHHVAGFGLEVYLCNAPSRGTPRAEVKLEQAQAWCREHARLAEPIPETTFANHCDMQR